MNFLSEKKYGVPSHNFVKKNVLCEKGDEITRFDGSPLTSVFNPFPLCLCRFKARFMEKKCQACRQRKSLESEAGVLVRKLSQLNPLS